MKRAAVGAVALLAALLAGCTQPTQPTPSPSPTPTFMCTPEAGGAESQCSEQEYQNMKAKDALYAEAEAVYRKYQAEYLKAIRAGGSDTLPAALKDIIVGEDVRKAILSQLINFRARELRLDGPGVIIKDVSRVPGQTRSGSTITMRFCGDSRDTKLIRHGKLVSKGRLGVETTYFRPVDGRLRIVDMEAKEVTSCDA